MAKQKSIKCKHGSKKSGECKKKPGPKENKVTKSKKGWGRPYGY